MTEKHIKDPEAVLDYQFDWKSKTHGSGGNKDWLEVDETILSYEITVPTGITLDKSTETDGVVTVWLSEGLGGETYRIECKITTNKGRVDERSIWITVQER